MGHLTARDVTVAVGGRALLRALDLDVRPGELVAIVGPNGVGKTTLVRTLAGVLAPLSGTVTIDGQDVRRLAPHDRARRIALLGSDDDTPAGVSVAEVVQTGRYARRAWWDWMRDDDDAGAVSSALATVALAHASERSFDSLSSGERRRAWLALALAQEADTIVVDEPTSHLDARYALEILRLLRHLSRAPVSVVAVLHDLTEAQRVADRVCVLGEGRILALAPPSEALAPDILERAYGIAFRRIETDGETLVVPWPGASPEARRHFAEAPAHESPS